MRLCPACGNKYPDDANFCPMDASKLAEPTREGAANGEARAPVATAADTLVSQPPIAGRFLVSEPAVTVPTGTLSPGLDVQSGAQVQVQLVGARTLPTPTMADRALRELKQLGKIKSERVLRVVDQGKTEDNRVYIATERPSGTTLEALVDRSGALPLERARSIVLAVGEALAEAQKVGVIHRDLAPRNVIIGDGVKVTGFGLAEPIDDKIFGAPAFLSPEQAEGKPVDQRSNIYSLGALFYYMLTGAPPFSGSASAMVQQHLHVQPAPPSQKQAGIPVEVDRVVLKALEKSGGRRHLTLRQLLNEVEALAAHPPATAAPPAKEELATARTIMTGLEAPVIAGANDKAHAARAVAAPVASAPVAGGGEDAVRSAPTVLLGKVSSLAREAAAAAQNAAATAAPTLIEVPAPVVEAASRSAMVSAPERSARAAEASSAQGTAAGAKPVPVALPPSKTGKAGKKGFRETAWFKKGELEEELARKAAEMSSDDPLAGPALTEAVVDESTLTAEDRARLSLKTGRTEMMPALKVGVLPGERMSEEEMLAEMDTSRRWMIWAGAAIGMLTVLAAVYFLFLRGGGGAG